MNGVSYQTLRLAAENATPGEWCTDDYGVIADAGLNANYYIASCSGPDNRANKRFIAAANPATVLALLDELERNQQYIKRRDQENEDIALTVGKLRVELEAAKSKLNEQREYYEGVIADGGKRIAELEEIKSAAEKLVRCKGRYHSEQNYRALAALFGVTVPDLPPLSEDD
ncbi:ead/Ea22-like family protein [Escherichia coli]|nr:ead/Ea22-like family protein [Escherichia coli]EFA7759245.1 ead/Ea22-like family protein [Escherichia coli]EFA7784370.1 ead/Ea22-like family protein [Escherichia coli]EFA7789753.1 ead/Ea22-like family protein [Escherichia coli]EFA7794799.1 ead/Ea22-like family protein [Escherichia coli]